VTVTTDLDIAVGDGIPARRRRRDRPSRVAVTAARAVSVLVLLGVWWLVARLEIWSEVILPPPGRVWQAFVDSVTTHDGRRGLAGYYLWQHLWASFWRILNGLFWSIVIGVPVGLLLGTSRWFRLLVEPYVSFLRSLPPLAYFSLLIIWFGIDDTSKIWLLFLAGFPPIALATASGVLSVRPGHIESARALGASRRQVLLYTILPSTLPDVITGVRIAIGFTWTTIVAAETSNGVPGIGGLAWSTKNQLQTHIAILCVIVIGITAFALDALVRRVEQRVVPWKGRV